MFDLFPASSMVQLDNAIVAVVFVVIGHGAHRSGGRVMMPAAGAFAGDIHEMCRSGRQRGHRQPAHAQTPVSGQRAGVNSI